MPVLDAFQYQILVEGVTVLKPRNLAEALVGYFLVIFGSNLEYGHNGQLMGLILERFIFSRPQTSKYNLEQVVLNPLFANFANDFQGYKVFAKHHLNLTIRCSLYMYISSVPEPIHFFGGSGSYPSNLTSTGWLHF